LIIWLQQDAAAASKNSFRTDDAQPEVPAVWWLKVTFSVSSPRFERKFAGIRVTGSLSWHLHSLNVLHQLSEHDAKPNRGSAGNISVQRSDVG